MKRRRHCPDRPGIGRGWPCPIRNPKLLLPPPGFELPALERWAQLRHWWELAWAVPPVWPTERFQFWRLAALFWELCPRCHFCRTRRTTPGLRRLSDLRLNSWFSWNDPFRRPQKQQCRLVVYWSVRPL